MKRWKLLLIVAVAAGIGVTSVYYWMTRRAPPNEVEFWDAFYLNWENKEQSPLRIVHFDLKGAPPKMMYLKEILPMIVAAGGNALLIEYEDMFPFEGNIKNISAKTPYSKEQVKELLLLCEYYNIEVIPLIQTFGHLEYVLKLSEFAHLREVHDSPAEICPSAPDTMHVIEEILTQVLQFHKNVKHVHIGSDEVFNINVCPRCLQRRAESRDIFVEHVKKVSNIIKTKYPSVTPIIWDDMLRTMPAGYFETTELNKYVEPMLWVYGDNVANQMPPRYWYWYVKHFKNIWIAGAFKGATQAFSMLPNMTKHYENQKSWLKYLSKLLQPSTKVQGYVLTGWSRYDHFSSLCELLPVGIPSLILNLLLLTSAFSKKIDVLSTYNEILKCRQRNDLQNILHLDTTDSCVFAGQQLIPLTFQLLYFQDKIDSLYELLYETNAWMNEYHLKQHFVIASIIKKQLHGQDFHNVYTSFEKFCVLLKFEMLKHYNQGTVEEWFQQRVHFYETKLQFLKNVFDDSLQQSSWDRRIT